MSADELDVNPFLRELQEGHTSLYKESAKLQRVILVPVSSSLLDVKISSGLIKTHILTPSKFFRGVYETLTGKTVELTGQEVATKQGFRAPRRVKILFNETFYNSEYKPYRIVGIANPIEGKYTTNDSADGNRHPEIRFSTKRPKDLKEWKEYLVSLPRTTQLVHNLEKCTFNFNHNYMLVPGFEEHAISKLIAFMDETYDEYIKDLEAHEIDHSQYRFIRDAIDMHIITACYDKLAIHLQAKNRRSDYATARMLESLQGLSMSDIGIAPHFQRNFSKAIKLLQDIPSYTSHLEKFACLQMVVDSIMETCEKKEEKDEVLEALLRSANRSTEDMFLTTDDMVPIFAYLLIHALIPDLNTEVTIMVEFQSPQLSQSSEGYNLVSLQAGMEYAKQLHEQAGPGKLAENKIFNIHPDRLPPVKYPRMTDEVPAAPGADMLRPNRITSPKGFLQTEDRKTIARGVTIHSTSRTNAGQSGDARLEASAEESLQRMSLDDGAGNAVGAVRSLRSRTLLLDSPTGGMGLEQLEWQRRDSTSGIEESVRVQRSMYRQTMPSHFTFGGDGDPIARSEGFRERARRGSTKAPQIISLESPGHPPSQADAAALGHAQDAASSSGTSHKGVGSFLTGLLDDDF